MNGEPLREISGGIVWYYDEDPHREGSPTKFEGTIQIYPGWVRIGSPITTWIPRENVDQVHES